MSSSHGCDSLKDTGRRWNTTLQGRVKVVKVFTMADSPQSKKKDTFGAPPKRRNKPHHIHTYSISNLARVLPRCERGVRCRATLFLESSTTLLHSGATASGSGTSSKGGKGSHLVAHLCTVLLPTAQGGLQQLQQAKLQGAKLPWGLQHHLFQSKCS